MKKYAWIWIVIGAIVLVLLFVFTGGVSNFLIGFKQGSQGSDYNTPCESTSQEAFSNWSKKLSQQYYNSAVNNDPDVIDENSTIDYKYNYDNNTNLCFIEYAFSWKIKSSSNGNEGQIEVKMVQTLLTATADPSASKNTLALLAIGTAPSGSQKVQTCSVMTPGHYDDLTQKPADELLNPTQCTSEAEFDSLVASRFGINN